MSILRLILRPRADAVATSAETAAVVYRRLARPTEHAHPIIDHVSVIETAPRSVDLAVFVLPGIRTPDAAARAVVAGILEGEPRLIGWELAPTPADEAVNHWWWGG